MSSFSNQWAALFVLVLCTVSSLTARAGDERNDSDFTALVLLGNKYLQQGQIDLAIDTLGSAQRAALGDAEMAQAAGALGRALLQGNRYELATAELGVAYRFSKGASRAALALDLGTTAQYLKRPDQAELYYREAIESAGGNVLLRSRAKLSLLSLSAAEGTGPQLHDMSRDLKSIEPSTERAYVQISLANFAARSGNVALAFDNYTGASEHLAGKSAPRLRAKALSGLAQLYEDRGRVADAGRLNRQALSLLQGLQSSLSTDLLLELEWREGRLAVHNRLGEAALTAYQRAAEHLEAIRQDLPIAYLDGRSSYDRTIAPLYRELSQLLIDQSAVSDPDKRTRYLMRARDIIELTHQAEMQDYLGDRCIVTAREVANTGLSAPAHGVAYLYTLQLPLRTELLLVTPTAITRHPVALDSIRLGLAAQKFAEQLRYAEAGYLATAKYLYNQLIRPFDEVLTEQNIHTLVVIPDGELRLVPFAALHDGEGFLTETLATATTTGITMTRMGKPRGYIRTLVAGLSEPGPVIDQLLQPENAESYALLVGSTRQNELSEKLREELALPNVTGEIDAVGTMQNATRLLDSAFTLARFREVVGQGEHQIIHIASHGVFGGNAESSFILTYDDLLTLNGLQSIVSADRFRRQPIELITLSACRTAAGSTSAPLGIAGAAIKARARSVLGALWPVDDRAARYFMEHFYAELVGQKQSKVGALNQAQIDMILSGQFDHPFFWAPFTLIGHWL